MEPKLFWDISIEFQNDDPPPPPPPMCDHLPLETIFPRNFGLLSSRFRCTETNI